MSATSRHSSRRRASASATVACWLCLLAPALKAQEMPLANATTEDPGMVIARTVQPRIAYRGLRIAENPIHTRATLFPARKFQAAIHGILGELVGDDALGDRGSAGVPTGAAVTSAVAGGLVAAGSAGPLGTGAGTAARPAIGTAGAVGGIVGGAAVGAVRGGAAGLGAINALQLAMPTPPGGGR